MESNTKKWRGTSLSQKQYDIIVSCLRTGNKPSIESLKAANLYGKLNGGKLNKPCGGYFRFKSIINRLSLRKSDGALTFKGNGKIVLPNSKFASVVLAAHKSPGTRHLNISATVAKVNILGTFLFCCFCGLLQPWPALCCLCHAKTLTF